MQTRNYAQETPDMVLYRQNKKTSLGYVKNIHNWTADYNFGAASEMSFEVPKKVYDTRTNSWMDNPNYDNLKPDMLLYLNDSTEYFKFTGESYYADYLYNLKGGGTRKDYELSFDVNTAINNFNIKNETMLFDIGTTYGYEWVWGGTITDGVFEDNSECLHLYIKAMSLQQNVLTVTLCGTHLKFITIRKLTQIAGLNLMIIIIMNHRNNHSEDM